ncbi:MAG: 50S ribosomal protein L27 [candidate division WS6 bacterium GW2011_GWA2_37_6]|uniref:Large ribosomal subunit protein bL27 n=1 Tax=candidate division WS6 bacterium GW2011_GWA2_37_6 TaxID=1619087 RepID=A0A0G0GWI7_9BACT|nr:MAG: 50S ribosomal protein L27 [candidate division WS6 bacterium GW2011_GWA2_37_6]
MAHTKAQGAAARTVNVAGKRLGIKRFGGEFVHDGTIIVRQKGTKFHPGRNTDIGRDYTIFATADGFVSFRHMTGFQRAKKYVDVLAKAAETKTKTKAKNGTK